MNTEASSPKDKVVHSPLLRFRKRANCKECPLHNACLSDKTLEARCIQALIADSLHTLTQLNTLGGTQQ